MIAVLLGCNDAGPPGESSNGTSAIDTAQAIAISLDPTDTRVVSFISWLDEKGIELEPLHGELETGQWRLKKPATPEEYDIVYHLGSFPPEATKAQMRHAVESVNLAYLLNPSAHLALSHAGTVAMSKVAHPATEDEFPKVNGMPVNRAIEAYFEEYPTGK